MFGEGREERVRVRVLAVVDLLCPPCTPCPLVVKWGEVAVAVAVG